MEVEGLQRSEGVELGEVLFLVGECTIGQEEDIPV
jgi:hypothetical protein